jgi:hypothetical protein
MFQPALDLQTTIRPRLMVVSARHALAGYDRARMLPRVLRQPIGQALPEPATALAWLRRREAELNAARRAHDARWHAGEHVLVMTALLHEARTLRENGTRDFRKEPIRGSDLIETGLPTC